MFAAVVPPYDVVEHLDDFLAPRREHAADGLRWSLAEQLHVTVAFYDAVPDRVLEDLVDGLEQTAGRRTPFEARIVGGGAFPDVARARVLYAGLDLATEAGVELERLAVGARTAAGRVGVVVDGQRFRPHVTLARLNRPTELTRWVRVLDAYAGPTWTVDRLTLIASHLGEGPRGRPRYETVAEVGLG